MTPSLFSPNRKSETDYTNDLNSSLCLESTKTPFHNRFRYRKNNSYVSRDYKSVLKILLCSFPFNLPSFRLGLFICHNVWSILGHTKCTKKYVGSVIRILYH